MNVVMTMMVGAVLGCAAIHEFHQDPAAAAKEAIQKTRSSSSYRVAFKATVTVPKSDPVVMEGETVWVKPGVLYIHSKASGGDEKRIIRTGREVHLYHEQIEDWVDAAQAAQSGAGRGIQNPDEVLAVLVDHLEKAAWNPDKKSIRLAMEGADIERIMKEQASYGSFSWKESVSTIELFLDGDGRIARFTCNAQLASKDPALAGKKVDYAADVSVASYEKDRELKFEILDFKTKKLTPLEIPPFLKDLIEKELRK